MNKGFTLIEMLLVIVLAAIITGMLFGLFSQSSNSMKFIDERIDANTIGAVVLHQLSHDLSGACMLMPRETQPQQPATQPTTPSSAQTQEQKPEQGPEHIFVVMEKDKHFSMLTFITNNPRTRYSSPLDAVPAMPHVVRVRYQLTENNDRKGSWTLTRQEVPVLDARVFEAKKIRSFMLTDRIKQLSLTLVYTQTTVDVLPLATPERAVVWNSDTQLKIHRPPLPEYVHVSLVVWDELMQRDVSFQHVIAVPTFRAGVAIAQLWHKQERSGAQQAQPSQQAAQSPTVQTPMVQQPVPQIPVAQQQQPSSIIRQQPTLAAASQNSVPASVLPRPRPRQSFTNWFGT